MPVASQCASVHVPCAAVESHMMMTLPPHCGPAPRHSVLLSCFQATREGKEGVTDLVLHPQSSAIPGAPLKPHRALALGELGLSPNYMKANIQENKPDVQIKVLHPPFPVSVSRK